MVEIACPRTRQRERRVPGVRARVQVTSRLDLRCVVKAGLLQLGQRAGGTGIRTAPSTRWLVSSAASAAMGELVRIDAGLDERGCLFPNGIVTGHEDHAAPHQRRNGIILAGEGARRILIVGGVGSRRFLLDHQRIGLEFLAGQLVS